MNPFIPTLRPNDISLALEWAIVVWKPSLENVVPPDQRVSELILFFLSFLLLFLILILFFLAELCNFSLGEGTHCATPCLSWNEHCR